MTQPTFYTGKGDHGNTARLGGKQHLSKSSALIRTVGAMDEAACAIGLARSIVQDRQLQTYLPTVQRHLYRMMAHLSATSERRAQYPGVSDAELAWLEDVIAHLEKDVPPVQDFVLPGASPAGAACHMARAIVRRAERQVVAFAEQETDVGAGNLAYINRVSSLMFVAALREDDLAGKPSQLAREQAAA